MSLVTRCPVCATAFRVQRGQLAARGGKVRCGKCGQIFDGVASLVEEGAEPLKIEPSPQLGLFDPARRASTVDEEAPLPAFMADDEPTRRATLIWGLLTLLAAAALAAQGVHRYRSDIAAQFPGARDALASACRIAGCQVTLPRRAGEMNIESSDLQADARREGVIVLNALLKNRGNVSPGTATAAFFVRASRSDRGGSFEARALSIKASIGADAPAPALLSTVCPALEAW